MDTIASKKEAVLRCALQLFLDQNIMNVTMADIAIESRIGRATLYRYFENREEIIFILATQMMKEIRDVAFADVTFTSTKNIAHGYKNMILKFDELIHAYKYMAMFDAYYTDAYPSEQLLELYSEQFKRLLQEGVAQISPAENLRHIMLLNIIMDFLEDLASHSKLIPLTQGVSIQALLDEFSTAIDALLGID